MRGILEEGGLRKKRDWRSGGTKVCCMGRNCGGGRCVLDGGGRCVEERGSHN